MMDFSHIDASDWPIVRYKGCSLPMMLGRDYVTLSDGIHLTTEGIARLADFTDDPELLAMALARRAATRARIERVSSVLRYSTLRPERVAALRQMHEEGER